MMNILVTGVGGPTPRSYTYSLKIMSHYGEQCNFIGIDCNPLSMGLYMNNLYMNTHVVPCSHEDDYWIHISNIIEKYNISYAIVSPEREVLAWSNMKSKHTNMCPSFLPNHKVCEILVNKSKTAELLYQLDLAPFSVTFNRDQYSFDDLYDRLGEKIWIRSDVGSSGRGSLLIETRDDLKNWIHLNPNIHNFIASNYLPGRNMACKLLYWDGNLVRAACAERVNYIMSNVAPSGVTGNTSYGRLLNEPELVSKATIAMNHIFETLNVRKHGFFTIDFKEDIYGNPKITEINIRHVAFTQCLAAAGANFAEDIHRLMLSDDTFEKNFHLYEFPKGMIFIRDVDDRPIIMFEKDLKNKMEKII
jgi:hypothetical protein